MIRYSLACDHAHEFEGWFSSSDDYRRQQDLGLVTCPICSSASVTKALMAPSVSTARQKEGSRAFALETAQREVLEKMKAVVAEIRANAEDVGGRFAEEARKIHYGEAQARGIIGQATAQDAHALIEEGIEIAPLPVLPDEAN